jgi:hypothetical protein
MKIYKDMLLSITIGLCSLLVVPTSNAVLIDSKLALVIDVSGSVDVTDYALQINRYAAAFNNATVKTNINSLSLEKFKSYYGCFY